MSKDLKNSVIVFIALSLIISSCTTTHYITEISEVPDSRKLLGSYYLCNIHRSPSTQNTGLTVSFEKVNQYDLQEQKKEFKEMDNSETRVAGWSTMLIGGLAGWAVAAGGTDEDGYYIEPDPDTGKSILIGSLILGGLLAVIPNTKEEVSSTITSQKHEEYEPLQDQDSIYTIWSSVYPGKVISRALVDEKINLDVVTDLGLDYVKNQDSIKVYFRSDLDETLIYTVDFLASDYLKRYLNVNEVSDSISLYQASTTNSPIIGHLTKGDDLELIETQEKWYKAIWNDRKVYLKTESIEYFYATQ